MQLIMSNPGKRRTRANPLAMLYGNPKRSAAPSITKGKPVAKKHRSAAQKAAFKKMIAANRSKRSGKRKARRAHKAHRAVKHAKRSVRRARRSRRAARPVVVQTKRIFVRRSRKSRGRRKVRVEMRRVKRKSRRARRGGSLFRALSVNPAGILKAYTGSITGVVSNLKQSISSASGLAGLAGGAIGAVAGGTLLARLTMPLAIKFAPTFAASPTGARVLSFANYSIAGFVLAKLLPVNEKIKRGILAGAVAAALVEVIRPGSVQKVVAMVPIVGPMIAGNLGGIEPELGDYIEQAMNGLNGQNSDFGGAALVSNQGSMGAYDLGAYALGAYDVGGMGGLGALGCDSSTEELVSFSQ